MSKPGSEPGLMAVIHISAFLYMEVRFLNILFEKYVKKFLSLDRQGFCKD